MANLTRYSLELDIQGGKPIAHFVIDKNGSWVNFEESKEFLKTPTNTKSMPLFTRDQVVDALSGCRDLDCALRLFKQWGRE